MHSDTRRRTTHSTGTSPNAAELRPYRAVRRAGILGTGKDVPARILDNAELSQMVDTSDEWIRARTGMSERHIAAPGQPTSEFATGAGRAALTAAGLDPKDLQLIVVATATPDTIFPPTVAYVQEALGASRAAGFDISVACTGFVNALMTAEALLAAGRYDNALVIGADVLSSIVDYEDRNTCVLFGDGAGAVVLGISTDDRHIIDHLVAIDGSQTDLISQPGGGSAMPATVESVTARQHYMHLHGRKVFRFAVKAICESVTEVLERNGYSLDELDLLIPHQANLRIIEAATARLGIDPERVPVNIERYGNTSSASIPILLDELARSDRVKPGQLICLVAFGAGLSWGATLLRW